MARMLVVYRHPKDPVAFERHYFKTHIPLAKTCRDCANTK
jgi:uncharacterized protein (TIGR02118 family)